MNHHIVYLTMEFFKVVDIRAAQQELKDQLKLQDIESFVNRASVPHSQILCWNNYIYHLVRYSGR